MLDLGCLVDGYTSDLTRTVWLGKPPAEFEAMYQAVGEAQRKAIDAIKNAGGMTVMGVDISEAIKAENAGVDFTD